jgi:hypothetical protein
VTRKNSAHAAGPVRVPVLPPLAALAILLAGGVARGEDKVPIAWQGKRFDIASLPVDLGEASRVAVAEWEPWAKKAGYRMDLDARGRVLVLTPSSTSRAEKMMPLVTRAEAWFDELLPVPGPGAGAGKAARASAPPVSKKTDEIPEDPEGPPPEVVPSKDARKGDAKKSGSAGPKPEAGSSSWGAGSYAPDSRTAALIALADEKDQAGVLEFLATAHPEMKEWASKAGKDLGFVLEAPLAAGYVENASGQEEWNPDHEILNRLVRMLTLGRFGQMPNWLVHAIAWEAETAFDGSIWVYPYRAEFVYTTEHTAWPLELAHEFQERAKKPLGIEELTAWTRGTWNGSSARHAFGLFHYLATAKKDALPAMIGELQAYRDENNRKPNEDGTWTRDPDWEATPGAQLAILRAHFGEKVFEEASAWLSGQGATRTRSIPRENSSKAPSRGG